MNKQTLMGKWHELKGNIKEKWGKLTDNDIAQIDGKREILLGKLESRYGYAKDKAEEVLKEFEKNCSSDGAKAQSSSGKNEERSMSQKNIMEQSDKFSNRNSSDKSYQQKRK